MPQASSVGLYHSSSCSLCPFSWPGPSTQTPPTMLLCAHPRQPTAHSPPSKNLVTLYFPPLGTLSALSKVSKALGRCESVGLQGEEVLLRQEEPGALRGVGGHGGLVELQLGVGGGVLDAS